MANGDRCVSLQQQLRHRTADDLASSNYTCVRSAQFDLMMIQKLDDSSRSTRHKHRPAHSQLTDIYRMKAVNIFCRINRLNDNGFVNCPRQRQLHQNAVNVIPIIERTYEVQEFNSGG